MTDNNKAPQKTPKEDKPETESAPKKDDKSDKILGKFQSQDELAGAYKELESKLGEQGEEIRQAREFATIVQPLLNVLRDDPELFKQVDEKLRSEPDKDEDGKPTGKDNSFEDVRSATSDVILTRFEDRKGITKLPQEQQRQLKNKIGEQIVSMTGKKLSEVDLRRLDSVLDKAYVLATQDKSLDKSTQEALKEAEEADGSIPSLSSSPSKAETRLTPEEAETATKMGLTREQYLEGKK